MCLFMSYSHAGYTGSFLSYPGRLSVYPVQAKVAEHVEIPAT